MAQVDAPLQRGWRILRHSMSRADRLRVLVCSVEQLAAHATNKQGDLRCVEAGASLSQQRLFRLVEE